MEIIANSPDLFQFVVEPEARPAAALEEGGQANGLPSSPHPTISADRGCIKLW
jgi:hypothetical protein